MFEHFSLPGMNGSALLEKRCPMKKGIPLIDPPNQSMTLADWRHLTWQELGLPDGRPVIYFHGGGGSSLEAGLFHREAVQNNFRLIATNRPGAGGSTVCLGRPIAAYSNDLSQLLDRLKIERFACLGESNGGMFTFAVAATMPTRVLGAVPIKPTVPWFDPLGRSVSSCPVATGQRMIKYMPWLVARMAKRSAGKMRGQKSEADRNGGGFNRLELVGPPPGIEADVGELQWRVTEHRSKQALLAEIESATSNGSFDWHSMPVALDFFRGAYDAQAPFARALADRNADARFHCFSFGRHGFSRPNARRRTLERISRHFESSAEAQGFRPRFSAGSITGQSSL